MFLELTEILRCPRAHDESYVICGPVSMDGRDVVRGGLACPVCGAEYPIIDRVAWFAPPDDVRRVTPAPGALTAEAAATFLHLDGAGGYVLLVGAAGRFGAELGDRLPGVGVAAVNPPRGVMPSAALSVLYSPQALPVKRHSCRGAIVGADAAAEPWLSAAAGTVLNGLRVIVEAEAAQPAGVVEIVRGAGMVVGERRMG